ncbi:hypothetical protein GCM10023339_04860 [Alloalcanivorax gelatiniphagus]
MTTSSRSFVGIAGLCVLALAATTGPATTAGAEPTEADRTIDLLSVGAETTKARTATGAERPRSAELDATALRDVGVGDRVDLGLFDGLGVTAVIDHHGTTGGFETWSGGLLGEDGSFTAVEVDGVHHLNIASVEAGTFEVSQDASGDYVMTKAGLPPGGEDVIALPAEDGDDAGSAGTGSAGPGSGAASERPAAGASAALPGIQPRDTAATIDVAIVYPPALVTQMGGAGPMEAQFALGIAQTNEAFRNSGVAAQLRLVGSRQVSGAQSADLAANLRGLGTPGDGLFDEAQALREETHADLVSLWLAGSVPGGASCGVAYLGGMDPDVEAERDAWSVVYAASCATEFRVFAHEVGHNFSGHHNADATQPPTGGKPYARGYVDAAARTVTVMSYYNTCNRPAEDIYCTRIGYYSNPNVAVAGRVQGTAVANNVQAINEQADAVANYRQSQIYSGGVSIGGFPRFKGTAAAATTPWSPNVTLGYQWSLDGVPVPGATASTFKLSRGDIGKTLSLQVTGSAPYYAPVAVAAPGVVVGKALFKTKRPKLRGVPRAGRVLSVKVKGWQPNPGKKKVKIRYQWLKNGKKIKGAKKATYRVRAKDRGKKITVRVTTKAKGYEKASRTSKKVKIRR